MAVELQLRPNRRGLTSSNSMVELGIPRPAATGREVAVGCCQCIAEQCNVDSKPRVTRVNESWRGTRTPNHLFTRSRHNVQGRASTPEVWRHGAEKAPEVRLRCCPCCCQLQHDRLTAVRGQLGEVGAGSGLGLYVSRGGGVWNGIVPFGRLCPSPGCVRD